MSVSAISCLRSLRGRTYTTSASTLNPISLAKANQLSADWKGTSLIGGTTTNYIGGEFVESKADKWLEIHDPVCLSVSVKFVSIMACNSPHKSSSHGFQRPQAWSSSKPWTLHLRRLRPGAARVSSLVSGLP